MNTICEVCGKETDEFGDVDGAIVCQDCMTTDLDCIHRIKAMEKREEVAHAALHNQS